MADINGHPMRRSADWSQAPAEGADLSAENAEASVAAPASDHTDTTITINQAPPTRPVPYTPTLPPTMAPLGPTPTFAPTPAFPPAPEPYATPTPYSAGQEQSAGQRYGEEIMREEAQAEAGDAAAPAKGDSSELPDLKPVEEVAHKINWGAIIKGAVIIGAVVLAGVGGYMALHAIGVWAAGNATVAGIAAPIVHGVTAAGTWMGSFVPHILPAIGQFFGGIATGLGIGGGAAAGAAGAGVAAANAAAVAGAPSALGTIGALTAGGVGAMVGLPELTKLNLFSHTATTTTLAADHAAQNAITDHATQPTNAANMAKDAAQANVTTKAATDQLHSGNWFSNLFAAKNTVVASQLVDGAEASHTAAELGHHSVDEHAMHSVHHGHDAGTVDQNSAPDTPDRQDMDAFKWRRKTGNNMSMANGSFADAVGGSQQNKLAAITQRPKASFADSLNEDRAKLDTLIGPA